MELSRVCLGCAKMARNPDLPPNVGSPTVTHPAQIRQLRARLTEVESKRDVGDARSLLVPFSDVLQANQSVNVLGNHQILDSQSAMMQTMIDQRSSLAISIQPFWTMRILNSTQRGQSPGTRWVKMLFLQHRSKVWTTSNRAIKIACTGDKSVSKFLRGPFKDALKVALEAAIDPDVATQCRGWKLSMMLPRMLFNKEPGSGQFLMATLEERKTMFSRRDWIELVGANQSCDERAAVTRRRRTSRRRCGGEACSPR